MEKTPFNTGDSGEKKEGLSRRAFLGGLLGGIVGGAISGPASDALFGGKDTPEAPADSQERAHERSDAREFSEEEVKAMSEEAILIQKEFHDLLDVNEWSLAAAAAIKDFSDRDPSLYARSLKEKYPNHLVILEALRPIQIIGDTFPDMEDSLEDFVKISDWTSAKKQIEFMKQDLASLKEIIAEAKKIPNLNEYLSERIDGVLSIRSKA